MINNISEFGCMDMGNGTKSVAVIILNYMTYLDTDACVECILKQNYSAYHIIVVDNGSTNDSYSYLKKKYVDNPRISVLKTGKNYGFAKGNNIGIKYAKRKGYAEYIMLLNNDTIIEDCDFLSKMIRSDLGGIGVIGCRILEGDNVEISMLYRYVTFPATLFFYLRSLAEYKDHPLWRIFWHNILIKYKGTYIFKGCIWLLTPAYFRYYDGLDSRTFLYCEEDLLYIRCKKSGLREEVNKETYLYHKKGQSTKTLYGNGRNGFLKYMLSSYKFVLWESIKMLSCGIYSERM